MECADCSAQLDWNKHNVAPPVPCPHCGSVKRNVFVRAHAAVTFRAGSKVEALKAGPGNKKKRLIVMEMDMPQIRRLTGEWVRVYRRIDKRTDEYHERVTTEAGALIHECKEPLSAHTGHGSAKFKKP